MSPFRRRIARLLPLLLVSALIALVVPTASAATGLRIRPGQSWDAVLQRASAGSVVRVLAGVHPYQTLRGDYRGVRLVGVSRRDVIVRGVYLKQARNLTLRNFNTRPTASVPGIRVSYASERLVIDDVTAVMRVGQAGFDIARGDTTAPRNIRLSDIRYRGWRSSGVYARGLRIFAGSVPQDQWPTGIVVERADLRGAAADLVQIGGGRNITIRDSLLRGLQSNDEHNDGIQSYGSDNLRIVRTRISAPGDYEGPDQGIMLSHGDNSHLRVTNTSVIDSTVVGFRGQGVSLAGTGSTVVRGNRVTEMSYPGSSLVLAGSNSDVVLEDNVLTRVYMVGDGTEFTSRSGNEIGSTTSR